jgi:hypothetical protein
MAKKSQPEPAPPVLIYTLSSGEVTVLPNESMEALEELAEELYEEFDPDTSAEQYLVDQMVHARWKVIRVRRLESQAFANLVADGADPDTAVLKALKTPGNIFDKLDRMANAADRAYSKAVRDLARLRANAAKAEIQNEAKSAGEGLPSEPEEVQNEPTVEPWVSGQISLYKTNPMPCPVPKIRPTRTPTAIRRLRP